MNLRRNLVVSLSVSIALHGLAVLCIAGLVMVGASEIVSVFRPGSSYVMVTLEESSQPEVATAVLSEVKKNVPVPVIVKKNIPAPVIAIKEKAPLPPREEPVKVSVPKHDPVQLVSVQSQQVTGQKLAEPDHVLGQKR